MDSRYIYIITRDELVRLDCSKVVYMVGDGNYRVSGYFRLV